MFSNVRIVFDEDPAKYHATKALSNSLLKLVPNAPKFLAHWDCLQNGTRPPDVSDTDNMRAGSMLEDLLTKRKTKWDVRGGRPKGSEPKGERWIAAKEFDKVQAQASELRKSSHYGYLMGEGTIRNVAIYATHTETGLPFKGLLDSMHKGHSQQIPYVADLKRPTNTDFLSLDRWCVKMGTDLQGAGYLKLAEAAHNEQPFTLPFVPRHFMPVFAVAEWPYTLRAAVLLSTHENDYPAHGNYLTAVQVLEARIKRAAKLIAEGEPHNGLIAIALHRQTDYQL